jgi:type III pantothenate kinase
MVENDILIDVGNSYAEFAFTNLDQKAPPKRWVSKRIPTSQFLEDLPRDKPVRCAVVSSVVPSLDEAIKKRFKTTFFVKPKAFPFLDIFLKSPSQVGADRLVNAFAAYTLYGGPCLIIDSGTATTCCFVDKNGGYQGGAILPGLGMSSHALHDFTAKIPLIKVGAISSHFGKNTKEAVQAGLYWGHIHTLNGFIRHYRETYPGVFVVGTGNGLAVVKQKLDVDVYDDALILKGLWGIGKLTLTPGPSLF